LDGGEGEATFPLPQNMRQHPLPLQVALGRGGEEG